MDDSDSSDSESFEDDLFEAESDEPASDPELDDDDDTSVPEGAGDTRAMMLLNKDSLN